LAFEIAYKKSVEKDLARLGKAEARRVLDKIEKDLSTRAERYPVLKGQFAGLRKLRVGTGSGTQDWPSEPDIQQMIEPGLPVYRHSVPQPEDRWSGKMIEGTEAERSGSRNGKDRIGRFSSLTSAFDVGCSTFGFSGRLSVSHCPLPTAQTTCCQ
jgi:hypothetical protein